MFLICQVVQVAVQVQVARARECEAGLAWVAWCDEEWKGLSEMRKIAGVSEERELAGVSKRAVV